MVCGDFEDFHSSLVCEALKFFKVPLCVRLCPCTGEIEFSQKNPCTGDFPLCWRDWFFHVKNPCAGDFSPVVEHRGTEKKTLSYIEKMLVQNLLLIFNGKVPYNTGENPQHRDFL